MLRHRAELTGTVVIYQRARFAIVAPIATPLLPLGNSRADQVLADTLQSEMDPDELRGRSDNRSLRLPRTAGGPQDYGSATLECRPWPAPSPTPCAPSPVSNEREPARLDDRLARSPLHHERGQLRPGPAITQRADQPRPPPQPLPPTPDGLKFAVFYTKVQDASCARSWPPTRPASNARTRPELKIPVGEGLSKDR